MSQELEGERPCAYYPFVTSPHIPITNRRPAGLWMVYEAGRRVGYLRERSFGWAFVATGGNRGAYFATGIAAEMDETCASSRPALARRLRRAGLEVRRDQLV